MQYARSITQYQCRRPLSYRGTNFCPIDNLPRNHRVVTTPTTYKRGSLCQNYILYYTAMRRMPVLTHTGYRPSTADVTRSWVGCAEVDLVSFVAKSRNCGADRYTCL
jgi:hypothetical protein